MRVYIEKTRLKCEKDCNEITRFIFMRSLIMRSKHRLDSSKLQMRYLDRLVLLDISRYTFSTALPHAMQLAYGRCTSLSLALSLLSLSLFHTTLCRSTI